MEGVWVEGFEAAAERCRHGWMEEGGSFAAFFFSLGDVSTNAAFSGYRFCRILGNDYKGGQEFGVLFLLLFLFPFCFFFLFFFFLFISSIFYYKDTILDF